LDSSLRRGRRIAIEKQSRVRGDEIGRAISLLVIVAVDARIGIYTETRAGGVTRSDSAPQLHEHLLGFQPHEVGRVDGRSVPIQQPDRRTIGLPPEGRGGGIVEGAEPQLGGDDAGLVVDAEEDAEGGVEDEPGG